MLHIERLVVDESLLGSERAVAVRQAVERELRQRLTDPGAPEALRSFGHVVALPPVGLPAVEHPRERLGSRVARAVQQGLGMSVPATGKGTGFGAGHD